MISDYLYRKASINKVPLNGTFELSPVCNFACKMCYVRKTPAQLKQEGKTLSPWQSWLELAEQCRAAGTLYLLLTGGEPFLYPGFRQLYEELHKMGFLLSINSNGTMIDEETVQWLRKAAPSRINITLYGASAETYARICGDPTGYERAMFAIRRLHEVGIPVVINGSMIPENQGDLEQIIQIGKNLGVNTRVSTYMFPPMRREQEQGDSRFTPEESARMFLRRSRCQMAEDGYRDYLKRSLEKVSENQGDVDNWGAAPEYMRCRAGRSTFWINWEGYMTACGMLDFPMRTEPFREPFLDCWLRLTECVRTTPVLQGCSGCPKREVCSVCVAMIYGETGTVNQKAPYLCRLADEVLDRMRREVEDMTWKTEP